MQICDAYLDNILPHCLYTQVAKEIDAAFPVSLALEFPVKSMLLGMLKLTEYLIQLPEEKPTSNA